MIIVKITKDPDPMKLESNKNESNENLLYKKYSKLKIKRDESKNIAQTLEKSEAEFIRLVESCKAKTISDNAARKLSK